MPKLQTVVTTRTEVELKPKLVTALKTKLTEYRSKTMEAKVLSKDIAARKGELEMLFADADEYEALEEGVRVSTPFGEVPMKIIKGQTAAKLNVTKVKKLLIALGATVKQMEACYDKPREKKPYLGVFLPREKDDEDESDDEE
jgi:hypothetical protein